MSEVVASYAVGAFVEPQNGESPIDADAVRLNDNTVRVGFNNHDAEPGIHFQGSTLAARPAAGTSGRKWMASDTKQIFRDNGSSWDEVDYLNKTNGGTVTGAATFSGGLTSTSGSRTFGATTFSGAISGTSASFTSTISSAGATFTGAVSGTSASFSSTLGVTGLATFSGGISVTGTAALQAVTATGVTLSTANFLNVNQASSSYFYANIQNTSGQSYFGTNGSAAAGLLTGGNAWATVVASIANQPLDFGTNGIRRGGFSAAGAFDVAATITATQVVATRNNNGAYTAIFENSNAAGGSFVLELIGGSAAGSGWDLITAYAGVSNIFAVRGNGDVRNTNNSYGAISDARAKVYDPNEVLGSQFDDFRAYRFRHFTLKDDPSQTRQFGLIAQEVLGVSPGLVEYDQRAERYSLKYSVLAVKTARLGQELVLRTDDHERRLAALEARLN